MDDVQRQALLGVVRGVLIAIGGYLVNKGYVEQTLVNELVGSLMILFPIVWSVAQKIVSHERTQSALSKSYISGFADGQKLEIRQ